MIRLKELRVNTGKSQTAIAKALGVSQRTYCNYENGAREADYGTLCKLADFFGVSVDYLLERDTDKSAELPPTDKELSEMLSTLTKSELDDTKNYIGFLIAKRKKPEDV